MEPVSVEPEVEKKPKPAEQKPQPDPADLEQDTGKKQPGKGRVGSLENPEVYDDVPGHIAEKVIEIHRRELEAAGGHGGH